MEDKPKSFVGSKDWIGSVEVGLVIDQYCDIPCKIVHTRSGELDQVFDKVYQHFQVRRCPIMMGGDLDCSSKGVFGACSAGQDKYFLILDPHFGRVESKSPTPDMLVEQGWAQWVKISEFSSSSFYNLCIPQVKKLK